MIEKISKSAVIVMVVYKIDVTDPTINRFTGDASHGSFLSRYPPNKAFPAHNINQVRADSKEIIMNLSNTLGQPGQVKKVRIVPPTREINAILPVFLRSAMQIAIIQI